MKPAMVIGLVLIVLGIVGFATGGITYTRHKRDAKIGPVEIGHDSTHTVWIPPILGGIALVGGIGLVVVGARS